MYMHGWLYVGLYLCMFVCMFAYVYMLVAVGSVVGASALYLGGAEFKSYQVLDSTGSYRFPARCTALEV